MPTVDRTPRSAETRSKSERKRSWQPSSSLEAPKPKEGYKHRWIRTEVRGYEDKTNVLSRLREGYEPVKAEEHPNFEAPTIEDGKHAGVIGVGGLMLTKVPEEVHESRTDYFQSRTKDAMDAVDNDLMKEEHPSMPIQRDRQTRVTFGGPKSNED
jgi:hypothetical protein